MLWVCVLRTQAQFQGQCQSASAATPVLRQNHGEHRLYRKYSNSQLIEDSTREQQLFSVAQPCICAHVIVVVSPVVIDYESKPSVASLILSTRVRQQPVRCYATDVGSLVESG
jgi:hypothetical protein